MQTRITPEEIEAATRQLAKTPRGRVAMQRLLDALDKGGFDLDLLDQRAFLALLGGVWTNQGDKVREIVRQAVATPPAE